MQVFPEKGLSSWENPLGSGTLIQEWESKKECQVKVKGDLLLM